jgi:hypothetical protein
MADSAVREIPMLWEEEGREAVSKSWRREEETEKSAPRAPAAEKKAGEKVKSRRRRVSDENVEEKQERTWSSA